MALQLKKRAVKPGEKVLRQEVHRDLGGQTQSGISPAPGSGNLFVFSDPSSGLKHGYADKWGTDGYFHYVGEGQKGDQVMTRGNLRLRDHKKNGHALHVFFGNGKGKPVTYQGQFECVDVYQADAPETGGGPLREVFVFKLRPIDAQAPASRSSEVPAARTTVGVVDIEQHLTEKFVFDPAREPVESERREAKLVQDYKRYLNGLGRTAVRHRIQPQGEPKPLFTDLFEVEREMLVEAKGSVTRDAIRMALGQLLDYVRFVDPKPKSMAVLVPSPLRDDLKKLLHTHGVGVIQQVDGGFDEALPRGA